ncbi:MAG: hypothetical protein ABJQ37_08265 [Reichenbachiella sp.]|uniref:hypothetical protein n=1 Tax=Reichenbachiella sp. TaxID=2184521 RepID=UPI003298BB26
MDRKSFLKKISAAFIIGVPLLSLWNCSSSSEDDPTPDDMDPDGSTASCVDNGTSSSIGSNHGHTLTVSKDDVTTGTAKTYHITGSSSHAHSVTVTADHFTTLKDGSSVTVESTSSGHTHSVTISCA